ncbi:GtrA family protein [Acinetobacter equi]|uniref:GtrA/DPMS transmembrane domain-containing protein n=1 Tax=Acinetobacter equi TaxID=1324350 RepID=A0A0N9VZX7_9GAMM|nr:GtrA family protein [Acinetobacter equi]ALH94301.1 hypothetical protein AOY20_01390 [Acinetobacter equi]
MGQQKTGLKPIHQQGLFFLLVGGFNALVHFLSLLFFVQIMSVKPIFANVFAFFIAFIVGFTGHLKITFRTLENKEHWRKSCAKWLISSVIGFLLNQIFFMFGIHLWGAKYYVLIWIVATGLVTVFTFVLARFWAFRGS